MSTADQLLQSMQERVRKLPRRPKIDSDELGRLSMEAMARDSGGLVVPEAPMLTVRMHGRGIVGHEVGLEEAFDLLSPLQHALSSVGQALARVATGAGRIPEIIKRATQLRISPVVAPGSVVFHLRSAAEQVTGNELPDVTGQDTLADIAMQHLMDVFRLSDSDLSSLDIAAQLRRFGPRSAKHLNDLAQAVVEHSIDLDLRWRSPRGIRTASALHRRAALGLQDALNHNQTRIKEVTLHGRLVTVSMIERAALELDDGKTIHLDVAPELAATLDRYCYHRVAVQAEEETVWNLSKGTESRSYTLLTIANAEG